MSDENVNLLTQEEWRMIHNVLSDRQYRYFITMTERVKLQELMNKVRDNYIVEPEQI
jgi:hypothetical protein